MVSLLDIASSPCVGSVRIVLGLESVGPRHDSRELCEAEPGRTFGTDAVLGNVL
ncbi:MAG: hypothetical protein ACR2J6_02095 [Thermoleophilaceae bacterium]